MITKQELLKKAGQDQYLIGFIHFLLDDVCPNELPERNDENTTAIKLIRALHQHDQENASKILLGLSERHIKASSTWISNDLLFVSIALASLKFQLFKKFTGSVAEARNKMSAGGAHQGLAKAVIAALDGKPDFTEPAAVFSIVLLGFIGTYQVENRNAVYAYDSLLSYDWNLDFQTIIAQALALRSLKEILLVVESTSNRGKLQKYYNFVQNLPKRISLLSKIISVTLTIILGLIFVYTLIKMKENNENWGLLNTLFSTGFGFSSVWSIVSFASPLQKRFTKILLRLLGYPKVIEDADP